MRPVCLLVRNPSQTLHIVRLYCIFLWEVRVDKDWEVYKLYITAESGYYCGVKIDVMYDGYTDLSWLNKTAMRRIVQKVNHIERVLSKLTTPIKRVALFSNGEAVYQLA